MPSPKTLNPRAGVGVGRYSPTQAAIQKRTSQSARRVDEQACSEGEARYG